MTGKSLYDRFGPHSYTNIVRIIGRDGYVDPGQLASALEENRGRAIPDEILDYLARHLRGKVRKPRGRRKGGDLKELGDAFAVDLYERFLPWLQRREERLGLAGWSCLHGAEWWQGPPHERAARMAAERVRRMRVRNISWREVQNIGASEKWRRN